MAIVLASEWTKAEIDSDRSFVASGMYSNTMDSDASYAKKISGEVEHETEGRR